MNRTQLLSLAAEHIAQASALVAQVEAEDPRESECLSTARSRLSSATRHLRRLDPPEGGTPARGPGPTSVSSRHRRTTGRTKMTDSWWLADQADPAIVERWSYESQIQWERELWRTVALVQASLGVAIPTWALQSSIDVVDRGVLPGEVERIHARERITRHDVKARLEIFCELAGHEYHHLGMTSADVVDNGMQARLLASMDWLELEHGITLPARHRYMLRGIKGAVGTQQDQLDLLGSEEACFELDVEVARALGFADVMTSVGQVYPRSQDLEVLSELQVAVARVPSAPNSPFFALLSGCVGTAATYGGQQWNEGDVSTSVIRRYCLPGAWLAASAALRA